LAGVRGRLRKLGWPSHFIGVINLAVLAVCAAPSGGRKRHALSSSINWRTRRAFSKQTTFGERNHR
jgi:hypothetical protein